MPSHLQTIILRLIPAIPFFLLASCGKKEVPSAPTPPSPVSAATAVTRDVELYYDTLGKASAYESVDIVSQVNGQIIASPFTQGSMVKKGDLLFEIFKPPYVAALLEAKGNLAQAQAELEINQLKLDRNRPLVPQKLISEQEFQQLEATVQENLAAIETARGEVLAAEVNLGYTDIVSPIDGMVGIYEVNVGNVVTAMNDTVLTSVQRYHPIYIDFILPVPKFAQVRKYFMAADGKLHIRASYLSDPSISRDAPMTILGNAVNDATGTVNMRATMENEDALFWPQQPVSVRLYLKTIKDAVLVPQAAVATGQNGQYVFIINQDDTVTRTNVEVGQLQDDGTMVINKGVKKGDRVVTDGLLMLRTGSKVTVKPSSASPSGQSTADSGSAKGSSPKATAAESSAITGSSPDKDPKTD